MEVAQAHSAAWQSWDSHHTLSHSKPVLSSTSFTRLTLLYPDLCDLPFSHNIMGFVLPFCFCLNERSLSVLWAEKILLIIQGPAPKPLFPWSSPQVPPVPLLPSPCSSTRILSDPFTYLTMHPSIHPRHTQVQDCLSRSLAIRTIHTEELFQRIFFMLSLWKNTSYLCQNWRKLAGGHGVWGRNVLCQPFVITAIPVIWPGRFPRLPNQVCLISLSQPSHF